MTTKNREEIPKKVMNCESLERIDLRELFEKDADEYIRFDSEQIRDDMKNLQYSIPGHQRMPKWNKEDKEKLIESVFYGYPMSEIILSEYVIDGVIKYNIEDGQTRLSVLQQYYEGKFLCYNKKFNELKSSEQNRFLSYKIPRSVLRRCPDISDVDHEANIHEVFERLQNGKSLNDADKLWNRNDQSVVIFAKELIKEYETDENYLNNKSFGTKKRHVLPEFVGIIYALLNHDTLNNKEYWTAYRFQHNYVNNHVITDEEKLLVKEFMNHYMSIIKKAYSLKLNIEKEKKINYQKCNKLWGIVMLDYIDETSDNADNIDMWYDIINIMRVSDDFSTSIWNGLRKGDRQNTTKEGISIRLERIKDFYANKDAMTKEHAIKWEDYNKYV